MNHIIPKIFDSSQESLVPEGFNSVKISIDGSLQSDLNWNESISLARYYQCQGFYLFWEISLGLFSSLTQPLSNSSQHMAFKLSLEHFRDLIWNEFREKTIGLSLYRGNADFSRGFPWDEELLSNFAEWKKDKKKLDEEYLTSIFCRNASIEYLNLLVRDLPDGLTPFLILDCSSLSDPWQYTQLINPEIFDHFQLIIKNSPYPCTKYAGESGSFISGFLGSNLSQFQQTPLSKIGVCLPSDESICYKEQLLLQEVIKELCAKKKCFRVIPEMFLTSEWEELDYLMVDAATLTNEGKRKLQGFIAAGGTVVELDFFRNSVWLEKLMIFEQI